MKKIKICHFSSVHLSIDTRVFYKECLSLAKAGFDVTLIALNDNRPTKTVQGVQIISFTQFKNRFLRILFSPLKMFPKVLKQKADIYHFHSPELIFTGLLLRCFGKKVVFDIHENIVKQISNKEYLPFASFLAKLFIPFNYISAKCFHLVLADYSYEAIYKKYTNNYEIILNMPVTSFLEPYNIEDRREFNDIFYIGRVTKLRGVDVALKALHILKHQQINTTMHFVGHLEESLKMELESLDYFTEIKDNVVFYGRKNLDDGFEIAKKCIIGISVLKPVENYLYSYPTKVFEYMSVSMPVITSNFELYKQVVEKHECGVCIDPTDPHALAECIASLLRDKEKTKKMGENGRKATREKFNWHNEEKKFTAFYNKLLKGK